jgi:protein-tyrosine-phosphatase
MKPVNVLFLSTANSARSIIAECLLNSLGGGRFCGFSAGTAPSGRVSQLAVEVLVQNGYSVSGVRSKDLREFARPGSPAIDFVITLGDSAAGELSPVLRGRPVLTHWSVVDPAAVQGSDAEKRRAFADVLGVLRRRVQNFTGLPFESVDKVALKEWVHEIGEIA